MESEFKLLRIKDVSRKTTLARSTIWLKISKGDFPKGIKISPAICVWLEKDIDDWIASHLHSHSKLKFEVK